MRLTITRSCARTFSRTVQRRSARPTESGEAPSVRSFTPEELLGPLNPLEPLHAPKQLFAAGHAEWLWERPRVSIVGFLKPSSDGLKRAAKLARVLTEHGALVVSGLAERIDASAHITTLEAGGRTIAVIGTPLSEAYPTKHRSLQDRGSTSSSRSFRKVIRRRAEVSRGAIARWRWYPMRP
ncbi:MAG: DNA-processing protein DprA [Acidobacteria bacterium]|nr:DNA-processing protein DprA [Acidobacteriota bacterium]